MIVTGFKLENVTDIQDVEAVLEKVRKKMTKIVNKEYGRLLGEETAFLCDNIALNVLTRNDKKPLILVAKENIDKKTEKAALLGSAVKYNFNAYVQVLTLNGNTYLKVICANNRLLKAFHVSELIDYSVSEEECKCANNAKTDTWEQLHAIYEKSQPLTVNLTVTPQFVKEKVIFPSIKDRAETHARHTIMSRLLSQLGEGDAIPPYRLMPYIDQALEMLTTDSSLSYEMGEKTIQLSKLFLDLDKESELVFGEVQKEDNNA